MAGINTTIDVLARSKNRTAYRVLESGLDSSELAVRQLAGKAIVSFRGSRGVAQLVSRFDPNENNNYDDDELLAIFRDNREKVNTGLRAVIAGTDKELANKAMQIVHILNFYEVLPVLLTIYVDQSDKTGDDKELESVVLELLNHLADAMESRKNRRLVLRVVLPELMRLLWNWLTAYRENDPDILFRVLIYLHQYLRDDFEILRDYLVRRDWSTYKGLEKFVLSVVDERIFRIIFDQMNERDPMPFAIDAFSKRCDSLFLSYIFRRLNDSTTDMLRTNIQSIKRLEWIADASKHIAEWSEEVQLGYLQVIHKLNFSAINLSAMLFDVFRFGKGKGRIVALAELSKIAGESVDQLIWKAADDNDPKIQIASFHLLRRRNVPNATLRILQFANSPNVDVREAVQTLIPEIKLSNFLEVFEELGEEQRIRRFQVIRNSNPMLLEELRSVLLFGEPIMKAKGLLCVGYGNLIAPLEDVVGEVLSKGETPALRCKAAQLLENGNRELSRSLLVQALHRDPSQEVKEAAKKSLEKRPPVWEKNS
ncbi:MAG: hypothetical protein LBP59_19770 [Planctomycetaceae bacterium]|jgi:hypothetical protein|nr:hypothetical protein [Planctomycetaceae bacterium]